VYYCISTVIHFLLCEVILLNWKVNKDKPICPQLYEYICMRIIAGEFKANDKLMSVREFAVQVGVNPNTVQRSYEQLEADGIVYSKKNSGTYVSEDMSKAKEKINELRCKKTEEYFSEMEALGLSKKEIKEFVREMI